MNAFKPGDFVRVHEHVSGVYGGCLGLVLSTDGELHHVQLSGFRFLRFYDSELDVP